MTESIAIHIRNLSKSYSGRVVLNVPELSIAKGTITAVIGPSGAGKSTLLRLVNMLEAPTGGQIEYFGRRTPEKPADVLALRRSMAFMFQKPMLLDTTVYENIAFGLKARGFSRKEIDARVSGALEQIGMSSQAGQKAKTLSGGEAQRVSLARSLVIEPQILLLDEPTSNLDPANVELLEKLVCEQNKKSGVTIIIITHNLFQARRISENIVFLYQGDLIEAGPSAEVFKNPRDERTAAFIEGRMIY